MTVALVVSIVAAVAACGAAALAARTLRRTQAASTTLDAEVGLVGDDGVEARLSALDLRVEGGRSRLSAPERTDCQGRSAAGRQSGDDRDDECDGHGSRLGVR